MALAIRLSRGGRKARPFYRIVVADKRMPRDGRYIEKLGTYNPLLENDNDQRVQLVEDRVKYWLEQGAKPSERVAIFLGKAGLAPVPAQPDRPNKSKQSEKTALKIADKKEKQEAAAEAAKEAAAEAKAAEDAAKAEAAAAPVEDAPAPEAADAPVDAPADAEAEAPKEEEKPAE
ncbi:MAG: 30S ribosomal protein S16 [Alphaproteobacteria bacterium]|nr:30S ribosomal protein S16 [Alphaproteobacteria bacterium]